MPMHPDKKRRFVRHPSDIPIEITKTDLPFEGGKPHLRDVSFTGLSFVCREHPKKDSIIHFRIPDVDPVFEADGRVAWSVKESNGHRVGVEFLGKMDAYRGRMVEQVCYIEHYRRELSKEQGLEVGSEEAARDWIKKYAAEFPPLYLLL